MDKLSVVTWYATNVVSSTCKWMAKMTKWHFILLVNTDAAASAATTTTADVVVVVPCASLTKVEWVTTVEQ